MKGVKSKPKPTIVLSIITQDGIRSSKYGWVSTTNLSLRESLKNSEIGSG